MAAGLRDKAAAINQPRDRPQQTILDGQSQADPKFQTSLAFTRITAKAVRDGLQAQPELKGFVPCRQTVGRLLNRLGYRLRRVLKARPEKNSRNQRHL